MRALYPEFIVFSVFNSQNTEDANDDNHVTVLQDLKARGFDVLESLGVYKGVKEKSIILFTPVNDISALVKLHLAKFKQESYLQVDAARQAKLVYGDGTRESVGFWKAVNAVTDNCTIIGESVFATL